MPTEKVKAEDELRSKGTTLSLTCAKDRFHAERPWKRKLIFPPNQTRKTSQKTGLDSVELSSAEKAVLNLVSFQTGGLL
jgi:hypothetical protein